MMADSVIPTARGVGTATTLTRSSSISRAIRLRMVVSVTSSALAMSVLLVRPSRCSNRMISRSTSSTGPRPRCMPPSLSFAVPGPPSPRSRLLRFDIQPLDRFSGRFST